MDALSDRDLIMRARRGELQAFGELVRRYQNAVFNVCYRLLGEKRDAEDLAQETFLRIYDRLDLYDIDRPFGPWANRVAANLCFNRLKRLPQPQALADDERDADSQAGYPERIIEQREQFAALRLALASLPPHYRAVVELRHFQELSYDEIAAELRMPLSDVKSNLFRARKHLAHMLNQTKP